jgi:hypothetical protein
MAESCCVLCGICLQGLKRRLFNVVDGKTFIVRRCKASPFVYACLTREGALEGRKYLCIPCVNWKRRAEHGSLRRSIRPMLQLDQMILYLMQPGRQQEPDRRCMERLVRAVRGECNPYRHVFPSIVQDVLRRVQGDTYQDCILAWWEFNGCTEFFSSAQEARRVRVALKACGREIPGAVTDV